MIVAASGTGKKRMVRVQFFGGDVPKSFLLAHSPLEPLPPDETEIAKRPNDNVGLAHLPLTRAAGLSE